MANNEMQKTSTSKVPQTGNPKQPGHAEDISFGGMNSVSMNATSKQSVPGSDKSPHPA